MRRRTFLFGLTAGAFSKARRLGIAQLAASMGSCAGMTFPEALQTVRQLGFAGFEILTFIGAKHSLGPIPGVVVSRLDKREAQRLQSEVRKFRHVSTHLPFHGLRPVSMDPGVRQAALQDIHRAIDDSAFWGAAMATLHHAGDPNVPLQKIWNEACSVYRELGDHAAKYNLRLGIETGAPNTVQEYLALIRDIDHDFVGGTVDTGHTRAYRQDIKIDDSERATPKGARRYNEVLMQKVEGLGPKLFHFHVDDVRPADWREHRTLGSGLVDWPRLLGYLSGTGYTGTFAIELEESPPVAALQQSWKFYEECIRELGRSGKIR